MNMNRSTPRVYFIVIVFLVLFITGNIIFLYQPNDKNNNIDFPQIPDAQNNQQSLPPVKEEQAIKHEPIQKKERKVIVFGLYGNDPKYTFGAIRNAELRDQIFPDWEIRFYVDETVPEDVISTLKKKGAELIYITDPALKGSIGGMFWRFLVADDKTIDRYIIRDSDSRLNLREKFAVDEWIESGKKAHVIRDHPNHNYVISGGIWGGTKGALPFNVLDHVKSWNDKNNYIADMNFLATYVWGAIKDDHLAHDSFHCTKYPNTKPFPTRRFGYEHVGQVFEANDLAREGDIVFLTPQKLPNGNPVECRREIDWKLG